jgi:indole-3-glycerol phosphate synthase
MDQPPSFRKAIDRASESFIFEIKRRAPSYRGDDLKIEAVETARFYVEHGVTAISVLTEPHYFGGCLEELEQVARAVSVPVIRKDFIVDKAQIAEARAYGAAAVLLIAEVLPGPHLAEFIAEAECVGIDALVEIHSRQDLDRVLDTNAGIIGVNNRNLRTMEIDMLHGERLLNQIPTTRLKIAESGLNRRSDITRFRMAGADAFLIGTSVLKCDNPTRKIRELMGL